MDPVEPSGVYRYALLWMGSPAYYDAPTLLVMQEGAAGFNLVKPFQYYSKFDGEAKDHGAIGEGFAESIGWHVSLFVPEERNGLIAEEYYDQHPDNVESWMYTLGSGGPIDNPNFGTERGSAQDDPGRGELIWYEIDDLSGIDKMAELAQGPQK